MMNCYQFRNSISNFIDENISFKNRQAFQEHLNECPVCQKIYSSILATRQNMLSLPKISVSDDFKLNLRNRILSDRSAATQPNSHKGFNLSRIPSFAYGFAVAVVAVVVGFFILQSQSQENSPDNMPPIIRQKMTQSPAQQPQDVTPNNPNQSGLQSPQYTSKQNQPLPSDTTTSNNSSSQSAEPTFEYEPNYEDQIKTVKDQR